MTDLCFDVEFIDTGREIIPVAFGIARDDGETYYAEPMGVDWGLASPWVREHVLPHLAVDLAYVKTRGEIAREIEAFAGPAPEWHAYVDHYDWVALSQLYGSLVDRPAGWRWDSVNLNREARRLGINVADALPSETELAASHGLLLPNSAHHALAGALWDQALLDVIRKATR